MFGHRERSSKSQGSVAPTAEACHPGRPKGGSTDYTHFWQQDNLTTIIPKSLRYGAYPEGWDVVSFLKRTIAPLAAGRVTEIGSGYGRLCRAFPPDMYLGLDVNPAGVERARSENPEYEFRTVAFVDDYEPADLYLAYTVLLHIGDELIREIIGRLCRAAPKVVVAEILGRRWRTEGKTPSFSRERDEYETLFANHAFILDEEVRRPYYYYPGAEISFLTFTRKSPPPSSLRAFPDDLYDPHIDYSGLYEDGWTEMNFTVTLTQPEGASVLVVGGLLPQIADPAFTSELAIEVDGNVVAYRLVAPGEFEERLTVRVLPTPRHVRLRFSKPQQLPDPDGRIVGTLLRTIGFESPDAVTV
jgi:SAM-dependent methyltransferase